MTENEKKMLSEGLRAFENWFIALYHKAMNPGGQTDYVTAARNELINKVEIIQKHDGRD